LSLTDAPRRAGLAKWKEISFASGKGATLKNFRTVHKVFVQILNPSWVIRRGGAVWGSYYRDFGGPPEVVESGDRRVVFRFFGVGGHAAFWTSIMGSMEAICELTRVVNPKQKVLEGGGDGCDQLLLEIVWD
jgi:hypothetical protein